jgi:plastocyanin
MVRQGCRFNQGGHGMPRSWRQSLQTVLAVALVSAAACGGDDGGPTDLPLLIAKATKSGDGQVGLVGAPLPNDLQVVVTRSGTPVEGVEVSWTAQDGSLSVPRSTTGTDGVAAVTWTLGTSPGDQTAAASVTGASGSPVAFTATGNDANTPVVIAVLGPAGGNRFSPSAVTVVSGTSVTWQWAEDAVNHNVAPDVSGGSPIRNGDPVDGPLTYAFTFDQPGTYRYHCEAHGAAGGIGMSGTVTVVSP